ncbi:15143_t:CDS:1, partial [Funneliformis geosporum]
MIGNSAIREIAHSYSNLKYLYLSGCRGISRKVIEKLDPNIEVEWSDTENDWSDSGG